VTTPVYLPHTLSPYQRELVELIATRARGGEPPSTVELAKHFGVARQTMAETLHALERRGVLEDTPRLVRSGKWRVTAADKGARQP
jgi:predicted transcriptional regulator